MNSKSYYGLSILLVFVAGLLGYYVGQGSGENYNAKNLLEFERAKTLGFSANWMMRFDSAFSNQPASVAIWEGSNLLAYITGKSPTVPGKLEDAVMITHLNLSSLYEERGESNRAALHLKAAAEIQLQGSVHKDIFKCIDGVKRFAQTNYLLHRKATMAK